MSRNDVIAKIRERADALRALGASAVYLYGSHARDTARADSDVDVFVDRDPTQRFTFIELTEIEFLLQEALGKHVEVSTRTSLHPAISREIQQSAVRVL